MKDIYQRTIFFTSLMLMKGLPINRAAATVRKVAQWAIIGKIHRRPRKGYPRKREGKLTFFLEKKRKTEVKKYHEISKGKIYI